MGFDEKVPGSLRAIVAGAVGAPSRATGPAYYWRHPRAASRSAGGVKGHPMVLLSRGEGFVGSRDEIRTRPSRGEASELEGRALQSERSGA